MSNVDDAQASMFVALHAAVAGDPGSSKPLALLVIAYDPGPSLADHITRVLLERGWELVAAPVELWKPASVAGRAASECTLSSAMVVTSDGEVLFETSGLQAMLPPAWAELAEGTGTMLVCVAMMSMPIRTLDDLQAVARSGYLVGGYAEVTIPAGWAAVWRPDLRAALDDFQ